jgi:sigma-B regulation protein RsbU (phosphoserine phosphatase)
MIGTFQQHTYPTTAGDALLNPGADWRDWEMELAREVQNRAFPTARPRIDGLDYYSDWRPARGLSGDYLDYFELPDGQPGSGDRRCGRQGLAAALLTSSLHSLARALRHYQHGSLSDLTAAIDELFYEVCPDSSYATMFVARYDPDRRFLHYVNAGHEPPVVLRKTAPVTVQWRWSRPAR